MLLAAALLAACTHVSSADLTGFGGAAAALGRQADATFAQANRVGRAASAEDLIRSGQPGLNAQQFPPLVPAGVARDWSQSLSGLERYGLLLGSLTDEDRGTDMTAALKSLGGELNGLGAGISPGVASGFARLGGALVALEAQRRALAILRRTDPHVHALLNAMADAVGADDEHGLSGTVASAWTRSLTPLQVAYAGAAARHDEPGERALIARYLDGIDHRDSDLRSLAAFRASLLALADAHAAAAAGSKRPFAELLDDVEARLSEAQLIFAGLNGGGRA